MILHRIDRLLQALEGIGAEGCMLHAPETVISGHNDHRIVMAMSLLLSRLGGTLDGAEAGRKSYPDFFSVIKKLGIEVTEE